eukprot:COSAG06_NODE_207_length_20219_cov_8.734841_12_plen_91_part_00
MFPLPGQLGVEVPANAIRAHACFNIRTRRVSGMHPREQAEAGKLARCGSAALPRLCGLLRRAPRLLLYCFLFSNRSFQAIWALQKPYPKK